MNELARLNAPLLDWYRERARQLPWRENADAYRVWVSEIMLQQTRVTAVLPYYARFMAELPTVFALANVPEERLLKLWEGLGYYSRARNLQKTAKIVANDCGGVFPCTYEELLKLPGIGDYTAGAILSIACGARIPAVDGNVLRVVARVSGSRADITRPAVRKAFRALVQEAMPPEGGAYNQAMMDLGATVCLPNGAPLCDNCPLETYCVAKATKSTAEIPVKTAKKPKKIEKITVFVLKSPRGVALRKRGKTGLLAGLWEFPNLDGKLDEAAAAEAVAAWGLTVEDWEKTLLSRHIFTHIVWEMTGYVLRVKEEENGNFIWADSEKMEQLALPSAFAKFRKEV